MKPINFAEANRVLTRPAGMTEEECGDLPTWTNGVLVLSCWELSDEELQELIKTKKVWVRVLSGFTQPPISLEVEHPFENPQDRTDVLKTD